MSEKTVLYSNHIQRKAKMGDFAGYLMPLWFTSASAEHLSVRTTAGLFDCTHMGILRFWGPEACEFLDIVSTNNVATLTPGQCRYSYILDPAGAVLDDIIISRLDTDDYLMVVNAANNEKIQTWLHDLLQGKIDSPIKTKSLQPKILDLTSKQAKNQQRLDIALQGPGAMDCLHALGSDDLSELKSFHFIRTKVAGHEMFVSTTGYTGAKVGFELYVHPDAASEVWDAILEQGKPLGILPCGLAARDSLRIEAGLPLYGHELAGPFDISPYEAGYPWAVKLEKSEFIGRAEMAQRSQHYDMEVIRVQFPGQKGIRPIRPGDAILLQNGTCIGQILSAAKADDDYIALAYTKRAALQVEDSIGLYYHARNQRQIDEGRAENTQLGDDYQADLTGQVLPRFAKF